jgi:hypothetical protein
MENLDMAHLCALVGIEVLRFDAVKLWIVEALEKNPGATGVNLERFVSGYVTGKLFNRIEGQERVQSKQS